MTTSLQATALEGDILPSTRWLGCLRISRNADQSSTIERHRADQEAYVSKTNGIIVGWAEDPDVSATKVGPFRRPGLGRWLEHRLDEFDGILVWKLDRIVRSAHDLRELLTYLDTHGKRLASVKEAMIDFDPRSKDHLKKLVCDLFMHIVAIIAEMEADNIGTRVRSTQEYLRRYGYWPAGIPPFPYELIEKHLPGTALAGTILSKDREALGVLTRMIKELLAGRPLRVIAEGLTRDGILVPSDLERVRRGKEPLGVAWVHTTVRQALSNPILMGELYHKGELVTLDDGSPSKPIDGDPALSGAEFARVQMELTRRKVSGRKGDAAKAEYLSGDLVCLGCGGKLYIHKQTKRTASGQEKDYEHYRCIGASQKGSILAQGGQPCPARARGIVAAGLHSFVDDQIAGRLRRHELHIDVYIPGVGSHEEITRIQTALRNLMSDRERGEYDLDFLEQLYFEKVRTLKKRLADLQANGVELDRWERQPTGKTLWDEWKASDWPRRRELLKMAGLVIRAMPGEGTIEIVESEDTAERLADYAAGKPLRGAPIPPPTAQVQKDLETRAKLLTGMSHPSE